VFNQITILAPGLLGASLAMAVRRHHLAARIHVWARRPEVRIACEGMDWCDAAFANPVDAAAGSDLCVICTPVDHIARYAADVAAAMAPGALITDVGSTKSDICRAACAAMPQGREFVGSHPMAGSDKTGLENARADLFANSVCFVTPLAAFNSEAGVEKVCRFWSAIGMEVVTETPERHDEIVAHISHLPHAVASVLSEMLYLVDGNLEKYAGGGLRDTTRIAAGSPDIWKAIFRQNREEVIRALTHFEERLHAFKSALHNGDFPAVEQCLRLGKQFRDRLP